jgi:hypothetical protein
MKLYASKYDYQLSEKAISILTDELEPVSTQGNGRFATNFIDEAVQLQALRIIENMEKEIDHSILTDVDIKNALWKFIEKK